MSKSVLVISYFFPPVGGAGVQRISKFVKYLPRSNWRPIVLAAENPSVPLFDSSLMADIPESAIVYKARTLEPSYAAKQSVSAASEVSATKFSPGALIRGLVRKLATLILQPDPQVLWLPRAYLKAKEIIRQHKPDAILATAPPFSSLLLGARLARKYKIPLVLDYRDEWDISNSVWENKSPGRISLAIQSKMQNYALKAASAVLATTGMSVESLDQKLNGLNSPAISRCIYNGFDIDDCKPSQSPEADLDVYTLSYVGTLWNLTSIEPLVRAVKMLEEESPTLVSKLRLVLVGRKTEEQRLILDSLCETSLSLELHNYMDHDEAINMMYRSQGLVLLLSDYEFAKRVVPGKLFEYLATGATIYSIAPEGEVWKLLKDYPSAYCNDPTDIKGIKDSLRSELKGFSEGKQSDSKEYDASRYERGELTKQLAEVLSKVTD